MYSVRREWVRYLKTYIPRQYSMVDEYIPQLKKMDLFLRIETIASNNNNKNIIIIIIIIIIISKELRQARQLRFQPFRCECFDELNLFWLDPHVNNHFIYLFIFKEAEIKRLQKFHSFAVLLGMRASSLVISSNPSVLSIPEYRILFNSTICFFFLKKKKSLKAHKGYNNKPQVL